jgi:flagellar hook-length control protein FliK
LKQALKSPAEQAVTASVTKPAAVKEVTPATVPELLQRLEQLVNQAVARTEPTPAIGQREAVKATPVEQPLQTALRELKQALEIPVKQAAVATVIKAASVKEVTPETNPAAVEEVTPATVPELLQRLEQLVNQVVAKTEPTPAIGQGEAVKSTPVEQPLQTVLQELKQALMKPVEQAAEATVTIPEGVKEVSPATKLAVVKEVIPATIPELLQKLVQLVNRAVAKTEPTPAIGQGEAVKSTPVEQPLQTVLQELKQALKNPVEQADLATVTIPAGAREDTPATIPELLQKLELLVNREVTRTEPTPSTVPGELVKATLVEQPLQMLMQELKQAVQKPAEQVVAAAATKPASVKVVEPATIPELLKKLEKTLSVAMAEKSGSSVKNLVEQIQELKAVLKKNDAAKVAAVQESSPSTPSTGNETIPIGLLGQMEKMLAAVPTQKIVAEAHDDSNRLLAAHTDRPSSSAAWIEYVVQQQNQAVRPDSLTGQNSATPVVSGEESAVRERMTSAVSEPGSMKSILKNIPPQQTGTAELVESAAATSGKIPDPAEAKPLKADAFTSRTAITPIGHTVERAAPAAKADGSVKSTEPAAFGTIVTAARESESKQQFSFTDGSTQHNAGEKAGNNLANPSSVTNPGGFDLAVQNHDRLQIQPQSETAKTPLQEHIMNQVKEKLENFLPSSRDGAVTMKLNPVELGELTVTLRMENMRLKVDVTAQNQMVKDTIMQNIDNLRETLARQHITIDRFGVSTGGGQQGMHQAFREGRHTSGNIPYGTHGMAHAGTDEIVAPNNVYWEQNETRLVNVRF